MNKIDARENSPSQQQAKKRSQQRRTKPTDQATTIQLRRPDAQQPRARKQTKVPPSSSSITIPAIYDYYCMCIER
jgi:hypothetical protein